MENRIIAAVMGDVFGALRSKADTIFYLSPSIQNVGEILAAAHGAGKQIYLHFDLAEGIGKDKAGLLYLKGLGADGIISTRGNLIKAAAECGLKTVQRFFLIDSYSVDTTVEAIKACKPDFAELMPGLLPKIIARVKAQTGVSVIAGGLIETEEEAAAAIAAGAEAVTTGKPELWGK